MITYKQIKELGFKEEKCHDQVYEDTYGYPYTIFSKEITKRKTIYWIQPELRCELLKCDKDGNILKKFSFNNIDDLKLVIEILN